MSLAINTNTAANAAHRNMSKASDAAQKSIEKLSSGSRINRAADDASGLVIAEKLKSQSDGIGVAIKNAQDGIGVVQTADGALTETTNILHRMRDLSMHAGNGATDSTAKAADQAEVDQLAKELDRIASTTKFGGQALLDGSFKTGSEMKLNVGATAAGNDIVDVAIDSKGATGGFGSTDLGVNALDLSTDAGGQAAVATVDAAIDQVTSARGSLGAVQNRLEHTISNLSVTKENVDSAESRIRDTDMAAEMTQFSKQQILSQASQAMLAQANSSSQGVLQLLRG